MKLRSHLFLLALGTIVPVALFAIVLALWLVDRERDALRKGAEQRVFALSTAVDARLTGHVTTLQALAAVTALRDADLAAFRVVAESVLKTQSDWLNIRLATPDRRSVLNLRSNESSPQDPIATDDSFLLAARSGRTGISNIVRDPYLNHWRFTVRAPVLLEGTIRYVLSADVSPQSIATIIRAQNVPGESVAVVLDRHNHFIWRTWETEKYLGQSASDSLQKALAAGSSGWFRGRTLENVDVFTPFHRSATTGWTVAIGMTEPTLHTLAWRSASSLALGLALSILLALVGANLINTRITRPMTALASATEAIGRGRPAEIPTETPVDEIRTLAQALHASAGAAQERQALIERERNALQEADRAKDRFLAMLSHELRNPLAAISAAAHVIRFAKPGSAESIKGQLVVERQTRHMAHLVGDLLDVSRITLGKMALEREPLDVAETVAKLMSSWRASGRFGRHIVTLDAQPAWVHADRTRIEQIAANLIDNALKFTPPDRRVEVYVGREDNQAILRVSDAGSGIPAHLLDHLFEPFVQANEPGERASAGLGIGLALVKGLAEMHGGSVSAENAASGGAVFTVRMQLFEGRALRTKMDRAAAGGRNILLIEDDDDTRTMLHTALEFGGHEVREARDGTSGLALAAESLPDVAVIDLGLPDIDGLEVARRLRSTQGKRRLALVALTGFGGPADQRRALDAGFDVHLTKPVTHERLKRVIGDLK